MVNSVAWNRYPACVIDCFNTPMKHHFIESLVKKCHSFPAVGKYTVPGTNELTLTACSLYSSTNRRCVSACSQLTSPALYTPFGGTSSTLIAASNESERNTNNECITSCQGLNPKKLTYTDNNSDTSCTASCPPSARIPPGSNLSVTQGTKCQNTCDSGTPVFEFNATPKVCMTNCLSNPVNYFRTTSSSTFVPASHSICVDECNASNGLGHTKYIAKGTNGNGEIECVNTCPAGFTFELNHSVATVSSGKTILSAGRNSNLLTALKNNLRGV
jgi:hypothetical protein